LAGWSAEESKTAISRGLAPDGRQLHPSMPYLYYNHLADDDLAALAAYLLSLDPVDTPAQPENDLSGLALPPVPPAQSGIVAPTIDTGEAVYGEYLTEVVLACGACHTPTLETGEPDLARRLAGGVSFSGEWGTIYSGNLTPDMAEGIGPYDDDTVLLAIISGLHPSGRPIYAMPWPSYSQLTGPDAQAVVTYLRTLEPVYSDIPPAQLNPGYEEYSPAQAGTSNLLVTILLGIILVGVIAYLTVRQQRANKRIRETDWEAYFTRVLREAREEEQRSDGKADHQE
jgi:mono/diheme cytochrome c family protein